MKKYYSTQRPVSIGTFPSRKQVKIIVNFDGRPFIDAIGSQAYGYIVFAKPLSEKEAADYELTAVPDGDCKEVIQWGK